MCACPYICIYVLTYRFAYAQANAFGFSETQGKGLWRVREGVEPQRLILDDLASLQHGPFTSYWMAVSKNRAPLKEFGVDVRQVQS